MAIVAAHFGQTRKLAADIKKQLKKFEFCPYCQKLINDTPVADHIYPVSKGGLSTKENMVYICKTCNSKKSNNTLREFIIKYNLDRNKIEEVLEQLKKKF